MENIGEQIKAARKRKGMTQDKLAEAVNVTRASVANWETGRRLPDVEMLIKLQEVLECRFDGSSQESAPQKQRTPDTKTILIAALVCAAIITCISLFAGSKTSPEPYRSGNEIYTIERFSQDALNDPEKAYLRVNPTLTVNKGENTDYWIFTAEYYEMNGIPLAIDRIEQVYFAKDRENVETIVSAADIAAFGLPTEIPAYGSWSYTGGLPVQDTVYGVGLLLRGTDANGQAVAFTTYIKFT